MLIPGLQVISMKYHVSFDQVSSLIIGSLAFGLVLQPFSPHPEQKYGGSVHSSLFLLWFSSWQMFGAILPRSVQFLLIAENTFSFLADFPLTCSYESTSGDCFCSSGDPRYWYSLGSILCAPAGIPASYLERHACLRRSARVSPKLVNNRLVSELVETRQTISGFIIQSLGISATFGICALIFVLILPLMYFALETTSTAPCAETIELQEKESFWTNEMDDKESYWKGVVKPLQLITYPAVFSSSIGYGTLFTWLLVISVLSANVYMSPPYHQWCYQYSISEWGHIEKILNIEFLPSLYINIRPWPKCTPRHHLKCYFSSHHCMRCRSGSQCKRVSRMWLIVIRRMPIRHSSPSISPKPCSLSLRLLMRTGCTLGSGLEGYSMWSRLSI